MIVVDVLDLVAEDEGQFVLTGDAVEQPLPYEDMAAGQRECIDEVPIGNKVKAPGRLALRVTGDSFADAIDVSLGCALLRPLGRFFRFVLPRKFVSNDLLLLIGDACDTQGDAR